MVIDVLKTSDEFEDKHSGTTLMALKTLTFKTPMNTLTLQGLKLIYGILIDLMKTLNEFEDGPTWTP